MPKKKQNRKVRESATAFDWFETWLRKQKPKQVRAKPGFTSGED
jgi:hypothetical protein